MKIEGGGVVVSDVSCGDMSCWAVGIVAGLVVGVVVGGWRCGLWAVLLW